MINDLKHITHTSTKFCGSDNQSVPICEGPLGVHCVQYSCKLHGQLLYAYKLSLAQKVLPTHFYQRHIVIQFILPYT